jgi:hypothetical protein
MGGKNQCILERISFALLSPISSKTIISLLVFSCNAVIIFLHDVDITSEESNSNPARSLSNAPQADNLIEDKRASVFGRFSRMKYLNQGGTVFDKKNTPGILIPW